DVPYSFDLELREQPGDAINEQGLVFDDD
ncbi:MAG: hypothetical protein QOG90_2360, partial [Actinomycetota bacterium]